MISTPSSREASSVAASCSSALRASIFSRCSENQSAALAVACVLHAVFHLIELADFEHTSLGRAFERTPGLAVSLSGRQRFVSHAIETLASAGEAVPLHELARSYLDELRGGASE